MGWTTCYSALNYKRDGSVDRKKELDGMFTVSAEGGNQLRMEVLKSAMVGSVYYAAVRFDREGARESKVVGVVTLTCGRGKDGTIWGYKEMDETVGPDACDCPSSILALLTPTDNKYANDWRARCRAKAVAKAEQRKAKKANGGEPIAPYVPAGVNYRYDRVHRWHVVTSAEFVASNRYSGVRFSGRKPAAEAVEAFIRCYGTESQRADYSAKTGAKFFKTA